MEKGIIDGSIAIDDIPRVWNEKMQELLGVVPPNDSQGCLQDVHWSGGYFGYFSTYSLGSMMASQEFATIEREIPDIFQQIEQGDFKQLHDWLRTKIHEQGCRYTTGALMKFATGTLPSPDDYITHLTAKVKQTYGL